MQVQNAECGQGVVSDGRVVEQADEEQPACSEKQRAAEVQQDGQYGGGIALLLQHGNDFE